MAARLPVECIDLKVKISATNGTNCQGGCWVYDLSSVQNWSTGAYNQADNSQEFISTDTNLDLGMIFENGVYLIEYFENNIENANSIKNSDSQLRKVISELQTTLFTKLEVTQ